MFIFLDESGEFTKHNNEQYFVIGSFTVGDQRRTDRAFRSWIRTKFPKKMRGQSEVKWSATGIENDLRIKTLKQIAKMDVRIRYGYFLRSNIPAAYKKKNKINSGILYTNIVGETLEKYLPTSDKEIRIFCDRRSLKGMTKTEFEKSIKARLLPLCSSDTLIQVEMIDSMANANMQIADWIAGAIARYLEKRPLGETCHRILKNNVIGDPKEFFTDSM